MIKGDITCTTSDKKLTESIRVVTIEKVFKDTDELVSYINPKVNNELKINLFILKS